MASNESLCIGPLKGSLHLQLSVPGREKPWCFSELDIIWVLFGFWCWRLWSPVWGSNDTLLRGVPLATEIFLWHFSCHPWELSQPSHVSSTLHISHIMVKMFLLSVCSYQAFCCSVVYSRIFLCNLVVLPDSSWEEVSVALLILLPSLILEKNSPSV